MTTSYWQGQHSKHFPTMSTDVVIVGGGYAGLSTAYWITEIRPDLRIMVIERSVCGDGASGRNAGFLTAGSASFYKTLSSKWGREKALSIRAYARESLELTRQHLFKVPGLEFEETSSFTLLRGEEQYRNLYRPEFGFDFYSQGLLPESLRENFFGALVTSPEYKINPLNILHSLRKILESRRVRIVENLSAFKIHEQGISTETSMVKAKHIVLALNAYLPQFHRGFEKCITPRRAQMLAVELDQTFDCPGLYYDPPERVYWRKVQENVLIVGGKRLVDAEGETGDFEKISPVIQSALEDYLGHELKLRYKVIKRWSGTMGFTEHELPLVGKIKAPVDTYMIGGFSGHGMGLGFNAGKEMAEIVCGIKENSFFDRFEKADFSL